MVAFEVACHRESAAAACGDGADAPGMDELCAGLIERAGECIEHGSCFIGDWEELAGLFAFEVHAQ